MAVEAGFDFHELDELAKHLYETAERKYPKQAKKFMNDQGNKGRRIMRSEIRSRIKGGRTRETDAEKSTSLYAGVDKGRVYLYKNNFEVRVYNTAYHAYIVEHGHSNVKTRSGKSKIPKDTPIVMVPGRGTIGPLFIGRDGAVKEIEGRYYAAATTNRLKAGFAGDIEKFLDKCIKEGLEL